jgi:ABC-type multidrug transport system fused ATPase/permease subunit
MSIEIKSPKSSTGDTKVDVSKGYKIDDGYILPENLSAEVYNKIIIEVLNKVVDEENKLQNRLANIDDKIERQTSRNIEIIGIFSSILALLIIDVSIIKSVTSFLSAILLIVSLAIVLSIFAILIHMLFVPEDKAKLSRWSIWLPIILLAILILLGIIAEINRWPWSH